MNKPISMSVKEFLIRTLAVKLAVNEKTIEAVVNHQFISANEAMDVNKSVEISGFGKFMLNVKKGQKKIEKLNIKMKIMQGIIDNVDSTEEQKRRAKVVYDKTLEQLNLLKPIIYEV